MYTVAHGRSPEWAEGQRLACVGARGRPLRLGLRCLSLQFSSPSARFGVVAFISGSKVLHTLAPWVFWHSAFWLGVGVFFFFGNYDFTSTGRFVRAVYLPRPFVSPVTRLSTDMLSLGRLSLITRHSADMISSSL